MEGDWMRAPQIISDSPPGLEYLTTIDQLFVQQKKKDSPFSDARLFVCSPELPEIRIFLNYKNKFSVLAWTRAPNDFIIKNSIGQNVYHALEDSDSTQRNCYGRNRSFDIIIKDYYENEVIHVHRPRIVDCCCRNLSKVEVSAPPGTIIGTVEQELRWFAPCFIIKNVSGDIILTIVGPSRLVWNFGDTDFRVMSGNSSVQVGKITRQLRGWNRLFTVTHKDYFEITFPMDFDVRMKALLLGALFLMDMRLYEH